jgi:hypothetical protein
MYEVYWISNKAEHDAYNKQFGDKDAGEQYPYPGRDNELVRAGEWDSVENFLEGHLYPMGHSSSYVFRNVSTEEVFTLTLPSGFDVDNPIASMPIYDETATA